MLTHEDDGMMGQFIVYDNSTNVEEEKDETISVFPNPTLDVLTVEGV